MSEARADIPGRLQSGLPPPAGPDVVLPSPNVGPAPAATKIPTRPQQSGGPAGGAGAAGVPPELIAKILQLEGSNDDSVSPAGAIGKWQIMPATGAMYGYSREQLFDPAINEKVGLNYVGDLWKKYGDQTATKIGYNAGPGVADKWLAAGKDPSILPAETQRYIGMRDIWTHPGGLSPEARALAGASQQHFEQFAQQQGEVRKQIERIEADQGDSAERRKTLADLRQQSHDMAQKWSELTSRPPVEKPVDMLANFGSLGTILALLGGFAGRHHLNIALAAAGTMMQGINANNHQQFQQAYKQWENQASMGLKMIELQRDEIRDVMADDKMARDEKAARLETMFRMNGMNFQAESLRENNDLRLLQTQVGLDKTLSTAKANIEGVKLQVYHDNLTANLAKGMPQAEAETDAAQKAWPSRGAGGGQLWSKDAIDAAVELGVRGDPQALTSLPRSGPARRQYEEELGRRLKAAEGGIAGGAAQMMMNRLRIAEAKAAASTAGRITMNTELYSQEAAGAGQLVIDASKEYPRYETLKFNQLLNAYETQTGDPRIIKFGTAINALLNAYGKMSNPSGTGVHDADKERLAKIMDAALSHGQVEAGVDQIIKEGRNVSAAAENAQREVLARIVPKVGLGAEPAPAQAGKYSIGQVIDHGGKKYRVTGGDMNDPDVEPVQ